MVLAEEKELLGNEMAVEELEDSDPDDEGEVEATGDDGDDEEEEEEELEDQADKMRESCAEKGECAKLFQVLESCNQRVSSKSKTEETCVQELFDFLECRDKCVAHSLFSKLK